MAAFHHEWINMIPHRIRIKPAQWSTALQYASRRILQIICKVVVAQIDLGRIQAVQPEAADKFLQSLISTLSTPF